MRIAVVEHKPNLVAVYKGMIDEFVEEGVKRIAIELPPDWRERGRHESFFYRLADYAEKKGIQVDGIDPKAGILRAEIYKKAMKMHKNYPREWILEAKKKLEAHIAEETMPPDYTELKMKIELKAAKLALSKTMEQLDLRMHGTSEYRNKKMAEALQGKDYEYVITASDHASALNYSLGLQIYDYKGIVKAHDLEGKFWKAWRKRDEVFAERRKQKEKVQKKRRKQRQRKLR